MHLRVRDERAVHTRRQTCAGGQIDMSPCPSSDSEPIWSRIVRESTRLET